MDGGLNPSPQSLPASGAVDDGTPGAGAGADDKPQEAPYNAEELLKRIIGWYKTARSHWQDWRTEAAECYSMVAGHQWAEEDLEILREQNRPAVTFNRIAPFIDTVSGLEIGNRQETTVIPRQVGSSGKSELLSAAIEWARDECDAEDEESEAFRDVLICGVGVTQTAMNYDDDPDGEIRIDRIDPLELLWDGAARKQNMTDARYVIRAKDIPVQSALEMFTEFDLQDINAQWAQDEAEDPHSPHNARLAPFYRVDQSGAIDRERQMVRVVEVEWWDYETAYRVLDPTTGRYFRVDEEQLPTTLARMQVMGMIDPVYFKDKRKRYWKAIVGNKVLRLLPGPEDGGFSYKAITGKRDRNKGVWYGLVRAMKDPQLWANKFFSQSLHIVNSNAKGGLLAEEDAFADVNEARDSWAEADSITIVTSGALQRGAVQQKQPPAFPSMIGQLMQFAVEAIPGTSGINMEMVALADKVQPGVLEMQRKQQGMTVLASIFNAFRRYRKEHGRLLLWFITSFIADGRLIRIGGDDSVQYVPLIHDAGTMEYDVIVDDAPSSPNMKERTWGAIQSMMPMMARAPLPPQIWPEILKYSPLPTQFTSAVSKIMQQAQQQQPQLSPVDQAKMQLMQAQAQKTQADAQKSGADAQKSQVEAALMPQKLSGDIQEQSARVDHLRASALNEIQNAGIPVAHDRDAQILAHDQTMDMARHALDVSKHALDVHQALNPPETNVQQPTGGA